MYIFGTKHLATVDWLREKKLCKFTLTCGGIVLASAFGFSTREVCTDSEHERECPGGCALECFVEFRE